MAGRNVPKEGDVYAIPLADSRRGYGVVLEAPLVAFLRLRTTTEHVPSLGELESADVLFRVWVMRSAFRDAGWVKVGSMDLSRRPELATKPVFFKKDLHTKKLSLYYPGGREVGPVDLKDCVGLERAAVWSASHIRDRLLDEIEGRRNKWVDALAP